MKKIILSLLILASCSDKEVAIENFEEKIWQEDKLGCNNERSDLYQILLDNKNDLLGLNQKELVDYLGRPDQTELYRRNQKFYKYQLSPGPECGAEHENDDPALLIFRFNATGLVSEITLYN